MSRTEVLGVPLDCLSMGGTVDCIRQYLSGEDFHLVVTLGAEMVMRAQEDREFFQAVQDASLVVPDSIGTVWAARRAGAELRERVPGVELIQVMAQQLGPAMRVFLLGSGPGVAELAAEQLLRIGPGIQIAGTRDGYFQDDAEVVQQIHESGANVLLAALGFPRQELWLRRFGRECGVKVGIGVGGSFDVLSGRVQRAPQWMCRLGLEWFYRLVRQPSRWQRMLVLPRFALKVISSKSGRPR